MVFGCCQFHWREDLRAPLGLCTRDHAFGSIAYWHSCYRDEMIRFQGWWIYLRTLTYAHTKSTRRHAHVWLFLLNVIKCCSDTAWYWLWLKKGGPGLCCCLTYGGSFRGCLTGCYKVCASSPSAATVITRTVLNQISAVQAWASGQEKGFSNQVVLLFG